MSTHSLCGAQPDVQLHHEHVVANSLLQAGCRGNISKKRKATILEKSVIKTEENGKNQTNVRSWILHRDGIRRLLLVETALSL